MWKSRAFAAYSSCNKVQLRSTRLSSSASLCLVPRSLASYRATAGSLCAAPPSSLPSAGTCSHHHHHHHVHHPNHHNHNHNHHHPSVSSATPFVAPAASGGGVAPVSGAPFSTLVATPGSVFVPTAVQAESVLSQTAQQAEALPQVEARPCRVQVEAEFNDGRVAYGSKTNLEIARALLIFKLCSFNFLVRNSARLIKLAEKTVGSKAVEWVMKQTFFAHFCAGEKAEEFLPVIDRLRVAGIGAILDYAAESDVPQNKPAQSFSQAKEDLERQQAEMRRQQEEAEQRTRAENGDIIHRQFSPKQEFKDRRMGVVSARTYFYEGEEECDNHMKLFEASIKDSAHRDKGFVAIKVTALGKPELLMRISEILLEIRRLFKKFENGRKEPNPYLDRKISHEDFLYTLQSLDNDLSAEETTALFHKMNISKTGFIDFVDWIESLTPNDETMQPFFSSAYKKGLLPSLNEEECHRMEAMVERLERLAEVAAQNEVRLLVDAEHTYFQPAIDHMVVNMQRRYNKEKPIVFNTYQCYLNDCFGRVAIDLERAKRREFKFAAKLVRGAYMIQERARALKYNYADPIQPNYEATNQNYHRVMDLILANHERADLMIATHNEKSILHAIQKMREYNIPTDGGVYFGQLLGMCDHVSFTLGRHGYAVYKYVPYGPVKEVMPYLIRRAEENSDILGGVQKERRMLWEELKRRKFVFSA